MAETEVYEVETNLQINGETQHVVKLTVSCGMNQYAQVTADYPPDYTKASESAVELTSSEAMQKLGQMQEAAFKSRSSPDSNLSLKVKSAKGGTKVDLKVNGYMQSPSYAFSPFHLSVGSTLLDEFAALDVARFGIYGSTWQDSNVRAFNTYGKTLKDCGWDVPKCLYSMAEAMVQKADKSQAFKGKNLTNLDKQTKQAQHKLNKKVLPLLKKLCDNSDKFGWKDTFAKLKKNGLKSSIDTEVRRCLCGHLVASSGSFLTTLLNLCDDFQCILCCEPTTSGMKYDMRSRAEVMKNPEPVTLPLCDLNAQAASGAGIFPTRFVAVTRSGPVNINTDTSTQFFAYPKKNMEEGGTALPVAPPSWMNGIQAAAKNASPSGKPQKRTGCEKTKKSDIKDEGDQKYKAVNNDAQEVMKEWAKCAYMWNALGSSQVLVRAPMIVEVTAGKRYTVKNAKGGALFTGFAAHVDYSLQTGSGSNNSATTAVNFTHVEFGSFKLPSD